MTKQRRLTKRIKLTKRSKLRKRGGGGSKGSGKTKSSQKTKSSRKTKSVNDMVKAKSAPNKLSTRKSRSDKKLKECEQKHKDVLDKLDICEGDVRQWEVDFDYTNGYYLNLLRKATKLFKTLRRSSLLQDYHEEELDEINELLEKIPSK